MDVYGALRSKTYIGSELHEGTKRENAGTLLEESLLRLSFVAVDFALAAGVRTQE
jgi:hypothetical protein